MRGRERGRVRAALGAAALAAVAVLGGADAALGDHRHHLRRRRSTRWRNIVGGTGGQLAAALAVGAALVGSVLRFNAMQLMGAVGRRHRGGRSGWASSPAWSARRSSEPKVAQP